MKPEYDTGRLGYKHIGHAEVWFIREDGKYAVAWDRCAGRYVIGEVKLGAHVSYWKRLVPYYNTYVEALEALEGLE